MELIRPTRKYESGWKDSIREFEAEGQNGFWNLPFNPTELEAYIKMTEDHSLGRNIPRNWMPATTFWLIDGGEFVGHLNLRHVLVEWSKNIGGHIGFAIRASARKKGYGTEILRLSLPEAKRIGLDKVLVTCDDTNIGSARVIEKNGGRLQDIHDVKGTMVRRYWISIP
jgi:predicted acetyltransferase